MKIVVRDGSIHLHFSLPTFCLGTGPFWHLVGLKNSEIRLGEKAIKALKAFRKKNGPFTLLEFHSSAGEEIRIRF